MIERPDSSNLALATIPILGQAPGGRGIYSLLAKSVPFVAFLGVLIVLGGGGNVRAEGMNDFRDSFEGKRTSIPKTLKMSVDSAPTWQHAYVGVPAQFTVNKVPCTGFLNGELGRKCLQQAQAAGRKSARGLPVIVYSHGCSGLLPAANPEKGFLKAGFIFVAMNHLLHSGDEGPSCGRARRALWRHLQNRFSDIAYTASKLRDTLVVDQGRFVLAGFSMGGAAVQLFGEEIFAGRISMGASCRLGWGRLSWLAGIKGDPGTPVLIVHGRNDPFLNRGREYPGDCQPYIENRPLSLSVVLADTAHDVLAHRKTHEAIVDFLSRVSKVKGGGTSSR